MSARQSRTFTPMYVLKVRPALIEQQSWFSASSQSSPRASKRVFTVARAHGAQHGSDSEVAIPSKEKSATVSDDVAYYVDTHANSVWPVWPSNATQVIAVFGGQSSVNDIVSRAKEPLGTITQTHRLIGRFMCSISSIRSLTLENEEDQRDSSVISLDAASPAKVSLCIGSGLGHGQWVDYKLTEALGFGSADQAFSRPRRKYVQWSSSNRHDCPALWSHEKKVRSVQGGTLILKTQGDGKNKILAMYKPRSAIWLDDSAVSDEDVGVGVLGICHEDVNETWFPHLILSALAIEEQIMWSKGFDSGKYHGGW